MTEMLTWCKSILDDPQKVHGRTEKLAIERFLRDLDKQLTSDFPYYFREDIAWYYLKIANSLVVATGKEPKPLKTRAFQEFILVNLMGWYKRNPDGIDDERRFRESYIQLARRSGKTFISGMLGIFFSGFFPYNYTKILCAATGLQQAHICFSEIAKFISQDPQLCKMYGMSRGRGAFTEGTIRCAKTGNEISEVSRNIESREGTENILSIVDEIHVHPTNKVYQICFLGQANVPNALTSAISTAGFDLNSFGHEHYLLCKGVLQGSIPKETQFVYITEPDEGDDYKDWHTWAKASPLQMFNEDGFINTQYKDRYQEMATTAFTKGGQDLVSFITKMCNVWCTPMENTLVNFDKFRNCGKADIPWDSLKGRSCYIGMDLSQSNDLTAVAFLFPPETEGEKPIVKTLAYIPIKTLEAHERKDKAPYRIWVKQNLVRVTTTLQGLKTDHKYILEDIRHYINGYNLNVNGIGYDPYGMGALLQELEAFDTEIVSITQSALSLSESILDFKATVSGEGVLYDKSNGLIIWSANNAKLESNPDGMVKLYKEAPGKRIDVMAAIIDAWKLYYTNKGLQTTEQATDDYLDMLDSL